MDGRGCKPYKIPLYQGLNLIRKRRGIQGARQNRHGIQRWIFTVGKKQGKTFDLIFMNLYISFD